MVTRAQKKSAARQAEEDAEADRQFGNEISSWESIPLDEELPEVPDEDLEETTAAALEVSCSQSDFIHQQKKDDSLKEYWLQARDNPGKPYQVVDGMLVWEDTDLQGEKTQLLVVLEKHWR